MKSAHRKIRELFKNRVFIVFIGICVLFIVILGKFYELQIIEQAKYANNLRASVERYIEMPAARGNIYDRYGREVAINQPTQVLQFDQQIRMEKGELNKILLEVATLLEANGDTYIDEVPISHEAPFVYTKTKSAINQFMYDVPYNTPQDREALLKLSAEDLMMYLRSEDIFDIDDSFTEAEARKVIGMRVQIYPHVYSKYKLVTLATDLSDKTVTYLEENHEHYKGMLVAVEPVRYYPEGEVLGNVLGYTRAITDAQYKEMKELGYDPNDVVGHEGIEKALESTLRGTSGMKHVEVDNLGRVVHVIEKEDPVPGNDVYLTIDLALQKQAYESVEKRLSQALIERLEGTNSKIEPVTSKEVIVSMLESSQLSLSAMQKAPETTMQSHIYRRLMQVYDALDPLIKETLTPMDMLLDDLESNKNNFTEKELLLALHEQGRIQLDSTTIQRFSEYVEGTTEATLIEQLSKGYLKPNQFSIDPFSGSAVVMDVDSGEVLALVGYPSFDSNQMTTNFNAYYNTLFDERSMLWNRAVMTKEAPGSVFKMITSIAGLEEGVITPDTIIHDDGVFEKAGNPAPSCWIYTNTGHGHGDLDVIQALEVSCNVYMFEVAYRLGLLSDEPYHGIDTLTSYAEMFGLGEPTGIEIAEASPNISSPQNLVKNQISNVLMNMYKLEEEQLQKYVQDVSKILGKSLYPITAYTGVTVDEQIDYLTQYEVKRSVEPLLQELFEEPLEEVLIQAYTTVQKELEHNKEAILEQIVTETMLDRSSTSLYQKTKQQLSSALNTMLETTLLPQVKEIVDTMDNYDLLDSYDYGYDVIYTRELKKNVNKEVIEELRRRLEMIDDEEAFYREHLSQKVYVSMIQAMTTDCLEGLELTWAEGTTVRTAIGQGQNAFTPLQITRYISGIANAKTVYDARLVKGIFNHKEATGYEPKQSQIYGTLDIAPETMEVIHEGMFAVTHGSRGSARTLFSDYEIDVAGKTGTAQKGAHEHSWFAGFAPYDEPKVAFVTAMYYADSLGSYTRYIAQDILDMYFEVDKIPEQTTLDAMFIE